jgi:hypothetical protein
MLFLTQSSAVYWLALSVLVFTGFGCRGKGTDTDWKSELSGRQLTSIKEFGEISDNVEIRFCSSGRFTLKQQYYDVVGDGEIRSGTWSVASSTITMDSAKDGKVKAAISAGSRNNVINLNGHDYAVTTHNDDCSGE